MRLHPRTVAPTTVLVAPRVLHVLPAVLHSHRQDFQQWL